MPSYPCPPVSFKFTEENVEQAKEFYWVWIRDLALNDATYLQDPNTQKISYTDVEYNNSLPWTVVGTALFTETPLPEGETHA